tara:strand:+ start:319 stop:531 length:213 start_codon:yes stop_codon:yes gene_type:complete
METAFATTWMVVLARSMLVPCAMVQERFMPADAPTFLKAIVIATATSWMRWVYVGEHVPRTKTVMAFAMT